MQKGMLAGLQSNGHNVQVLRSCPMPIPDGIREHIVGFNSLFQNLPEVLSIPHNYRVLKSFGKIRSSFKPDFIYQRHSGLNIVGALIAKKYGVPYVLQFDGSEVWMKKNWGKLYFEKLMNSAEQIALHSAQAITVVSSAMKRIVVELGIDPVKVFVVPNGVDPIRFSPKIEAFELRREYNLNGKFVIGFIGTFGPWHGVTVLAQCIKKVIKDIPNAHFLFVGDGSLRMEVEEIVSSNNLQDYTTFTGLIKYDEIPYYNSLCDVLTSPNVENSDGTEFFNSPIKLFEYMAMQKAIIVSPIGQNAEVIQDGINGLYAEQNNPNALAQSIIAIANNDELRNSIALQARADAINKYDWRVHANHIVDAFEQTQQMTIQYRKP
jgi:glycosyltransferase involved in cell wall biosynthesis